MTKNFDANSRDGAPLCCVVCEREIPGGNWFARVKLGNGRVALCRPRCTELFAEDPERFVARAGSLPFLEKVAAG